MFSLIGSRKVQAGRTDQINRLRIVPNYTKGVASKRSLRNRKGNLYYPICILTGNETGTNNRFIENSAPSHVEPETDFLKT